MADFIIAGILLVIIGTAIVYIVKEKKRGTKCIGCPAAGSCSGNHGNAGCGCDGLSDTKKKE